MRDYAGWTALLIAEHNNGKELGELLENGFPEFVLNNKIMWSIGKCDGLFLKY